MLIGNIVGLTTDLEFSLRFVLFGIAGALFLDIDMLIYRFALGGRFDEWAHKHRVLTIRPREFAVFLFKKTRVWSHPGFSFLITLLKQSLQISQSVSLARPEDRQLLWQCCLPHPFPQSLFQILDVCLKEVLCQNPRRHYLHG